MNGTAVKQMSVNDPENFSVKLVQNEYIVNSN